MQRRNTPRQEARRESRQESGDIRHDRAAEISESLGWQNRIEEVRHLRTRDAKRNHITNCIDNCGFDLLVVMVAWSGFFTDSFNLFSTNITLPILSSLYWNDTTNESVDTLINCLTLAGSIVGQILFGVLADYFGRQRLYGVELVVVIIATVGIVESSEGFGSWMNIQAMLGFWRFVMGVGIGAEYPLSAVITAEWAAKNFRGRMMACVFFAQPLGQLFASLVGLWVLLGQRNSTNVSMDKVWRIVSSVGAIPAVVAIIFRFTITDPGRYTLDVQNEGERAVSDTDSHFGRMSHESLLEMQQMHQEPIPQDEPLPPQFTIDGIMQYFYVEGNWRYLAGCCFCWFALDIAFFGLGPMHPLLLKDSMRSLITVSIGSVLGTLVLIAFIDKIRRRQVLIYSFLALGILFVFTGITFMLARNHRAHILTIVLCSICQFVFNLGPNTLTFIIPAEIFPTRYRGTCHGISAAAGKLGSIIVQVILYGAQNWIVGPNSAGLGWLFIIFAFIMTSGSFFAWAWLPEVQEVRDENGVTKLRNKSLEDLARGVSWARRNGEIVGMRNKVKAALKRWRA